MNTPVKSKTFIHNFTYRTFSSFIQMKDPFQFNFEEISTTAVSSWTSSYKTQAVSLTTVVLISF